jgi:hypothetical protein
MCCFDFENRKYKYVRDWKRMKIARKLGFVGDFLMESAEFRGTLHSPYILE